MEIWQAISAAITGLCAGLIGVALARLPRSSISLPVHCFVVSGALWALGDLIAQHSSNMLWKQVGVTILYTGALAMPALWWWVVLRWSQDVQSGLPFGATGWTRAPLWFVGAMWLVVITNPWHGAFLTPVVGGRNLYEPLWYAMVVPNCALILAALGVELEVARRVRRPSVRRQAAFLVSASLVTLFGSLAYLNQVVEVNLTLVMLSTSGTLLILGMAREGLFGVWPAALPGIAEDHPDGLVVVGPDGHVRFANARAHELLAPVEVQPDVPFARTLREAKLQPESATRLERASEDTWWETLLGLGGVVLRVDAPPSRWLQFNASVVRGHRGQTKGYCLQISDLTAQKQAELQASQRRRLDSVAALSRTVAREFQGTLAVVQGNADLLAKHAAAQGPAFERQVSRIAEAARYGSDLAHQLQLYTGSIDTTRVVLELSEVVGECCSLVETDTRPDLRLKRTHAAEHLPVLVDAIQIRHCIFNLLMNAIDATSDPQADDWPHPIGEILVSTGARALDPATEQHLVYGAGQPAGSFAYVRIRDNGGGMDPATEERAFEPFFSTRDKERGNGLPTVLGIARAHGALVELRNEYGRGCEFTLYFPLDLDGELADEGGPA